MDWSNPLIYVVGGIAGIGAIWKLGEWKGRTDDSVSAIKDTIREIREDIKKILGRLPPPAVEQGSPLRLTEFGEEISRRLDARSWATETASNLLPEVRGKQAFQVDEFCETYVQTRLSEEWKTEVARCAYELGRDRESILSVLRVVLRDELLSRLPAEPQTN